jgi:hypothetical protein
MQPPSVEEQPLASASAPAAPDDADTATAAAAPEENN